MDEEDTAWLTIINKTRAKQGLQPVSVDTLELLMDRLEKESYFQVSRVCISLIDCVKNLECYHFTESVEVWGLSLNVIQMYFIRELKCMKYTNILNIL